MDQTRGILTWVTDNVPGNFHQEVGYATVRLWVFHVIVTLMHRGMLWLCGTPSVLEHCVEQTECLLYSRVTSACDFSCDQCFWKSIPLPYDWLTLAHAVLCYL